MLRSTSCSLSFWVSDFMDSNEVAISKTSNLVDLMIKFEIFQFDRFIP